MSNPESVFNEAAAAVDRGDWEQAASLCDPASLSVFKRELLERVDAKQEAWTVERMLQFQPDLPREVAEYQIAQFNGISDAKRVLEREVPSVASVEQLRDMSPVEVFAAWLEGQSYERQVEGMRRETSIPPEVLEVVLRSRPERTFKILGMIPDGDRIAHVVYRQECTWPDDSDDSDETPQPAIDVDPEESSFLADRSQPAPEFSTLRRQGDGSWRMIADHRFLGLGSGGFSVGMADDAGTSSLGSNP